MKLLIVDDHAGIRDTLRLLLCDTADEIVEAEDGADAVALCAATQPDWVLMDIEMKEMDGIEATRKIKEMHPDARILVLTNFEDDFMRAAAMAAGARGFFLKDDLTKVARFLQRRPDFSPCQAEPVSLLDSRGHSTMLETEKWPSRDFIAMTAARPGALEVKDQTRRASFECFASSSSASPGIWAASCRDCLVHALTKLDALRDWSEHGDQAFQSIRRSLEPSLWLNETLLEPTKGLEAFNEWQHGIQELSILRKAPQYGERVNEKTKLVCEDAIEELIQGAVLLITQTVLLTCQNLPSEGHEQRKKVDEKLANIQVELDLANAEATNCEFDRALSHYGNAWSHASSAAQLAGCEVFPCLGFQA